MFSYIDILSISKQTLPATHYSCTLSRRAIPSVVMNPPVPSINSTATSTHRVSKADVPSALFDSNGTSDIKPLDVLSTPRMIALMEAASSNLLLPFLPSGQISIGTSVDVVHIAPCPVGTEVSATATFRGREGKSYVFEVQVNDKVGVVGRGTHKRAVVELERMQKAARKQMEQWEQTKEG
jgi:fluoroacetyl-CoA thioesterase